MTATKRILIVDDDRETCRLIAELIGRAGAHHRRRGDGR